MAARASEGHEVIAAAAIIVTGSLKHVRFLDHQCRAAAAAAVAGAGADVLGGPALLTGPG